MARAAEEARSQGGLSRAGAGEDSLRMEEIETAEEPGGRGAAREEPGDKEDKEEDVPGEMWRPASPPVKRSRGWRPTPSVSRLAGRDAKITSDLSS